jgi:hypothetical protein
LPKIVTPSAVALPRTTTVSHIVPVISSIHDNGKLTRRGITIMPVVLEIYEGLLSPNAIRMRHHVNIALGCNQSADRRV